MTLKIAHAKALLLIAIGLTGIALSSFAIENQVRIFHVASDSMAPNFYKGDILFTRAVAAQSLSVGDIPILNSPREPGLLYSHRIVEKSVKDGKIQLKTQGDANPIEDDWIYELTSQKIPIYLVRIPTRSISFLFTNKLFAIGIYAALVTLLATLLFKPRDQLAK